MSTDVAPQPAGSRLMVGFHGRRPSDELRRVVLETGARGIVLFARNLRGAGQARDLIADLRERFPWPLLIAIDQEGGAVVRITEGMTVFPGNMALGAAAATDLARSQGEASGRQLRAIGVDLNLAPVVDLQTNPANPGIGIRSLGADRVRAEPLARALIAGHSAHDVGSCLKHFPGKGAAAVDAHLDLPVLQTALEAFREPHLAMFERLLPDVAHGAVMTTHMVVKGLDAEAPVTFSRRVVTELLRRRLGHAGLIVADDLEMGAIAKYHAVPQAAVMAARAGHDMLPICHDWRRQLEAGRRLEAALADGRLDRQEHRAACARIDAACRRARSRTAPPALLEGSSAGDVVAHTIAERAVHRFSDRRGLLPISPAHDLAVLAPVPHAVVGVEEEMEGDWRGWLVRAFNAEGLTPGLLETFSPALGLEAADVLLTQVSGRDRVVLFTWNAHGTPEMRALLEKACVRLRERLIIVHLRNPFDQAFVPDDVTALTPFGYRLEQVRAAVACLAGRLQAHGTLPAPIR